MSDLNILTLRAHRITGAPVLECKALLASLPPEMARTMLRKAEREASSVLKDPLEDEPLHAAVFATRRAAAEDQVTRRRASRLAEIEATMPELAELYRSPRGFSVEVWRELKALLLLDGISWMTPYELNPWRHF